MILLMESSLMRSLRTKERPCLHTTEDGNENAIGQLMRRQDGRVRVILLELAVVVKETQEGLLGMKPEMLHPGLLVSRKRILVVELCHPRNGRRCRGI
jgi:hypothetical protein